MGFPWLARDRSPRHCSRERPSSSARPSTSCRTTRGERCSRAGLRSRSSARVGLRAAAARSRRRSRSSRSPEGWRSPPCRPPRARGCCRGRRGRSRTPGTMPPPSTSSGTCATSRSPSASGPSKCCACARRGPPTGARSCSPTSTACAFCGRSSRSSSRAGAGASCAWRDRSRGRPFAPRWWSRRRPTRSWSRPASPSASGCRPRPARSTSPRTAPRASAASRPRGSATWQRASNRDPSPRALRALGARYPESVAGGGLSFAGAQLPAFGTSGRDRDLAVLFRSHRGDPMWDAWSVRLLQGAHGHARRGLPVPGDGCAGSLAAHHTRLRRAREPARKVGCAGALGRRRRRRLLPDVRRLARRARAARRRPGARGRGFRAGRSPQRRLPRDRSRRARMGRSLVSRLRMAAIRCHAGARPARPAHRPRRPRSTVRGPGTPTAGAGTTGGLRLPLARLRDVLASGAVGGSGQRDGVVGTRPAIAATALAVLLAAALPQARARPTRPPARPGAQGARARTGVRRGSGRRARAVAHAA